jgi:hypothetical protein
MPHEINDINARIIVPNEVSEMGRRALEENGNNGLLETIIKIILHAMVDDPYYVDLKKTCEASAVDPMDGQKASISVVFLAKDWECTVLGHMGHASPLGMAHVIADCHGMNLFEYLTQCLYCSPTVMAKNDESASAQDLPEAFP